MNSKPILIVAGEPNSIFFEIFFKSLKSKNFKNPIILIGSLKILQLQMRKLSYRKKINLLKIKNLKNEKINNKSINLINVSIALILNISLNYILIPLRLAFQKKSMVATVATLMKLI